MIIVIFFNNHPFLYVIIIITLPEVKDVKDVILCQYLNLIKIGCSFIQNVSMLLLKCLFRKWKNIYNLKIIEYIINISNIN